jgi:hypothetical protein
MNGNLSKFERGTISDMSWEVFLEEWGYVIDKYAMTVEDLRKQYDHVMGNEIWINDEYQVNIDKNAKGFGDQLIIWHLSIKRLDKEPVHDWRDLQEIKNMLVGREYEAVELYPSSKRVVDTANQYHLWVFYLLHGEEEDTIPMIPIGWTNGMISEDENNNSKQRKF